jgi:hypothetical protein
MRYHLQIVTGESIMKTLLKSLVLVSVATAGSQGLAQVYESKDAEGHPVFSDQPAPDARPVDIAPANTADAVAAESPQPGQAAPPKPATAPARGSPEYEQKLDREMEAYRREEEQQERERHSEKRHEVGHDASEKRHEVGHDASEQRHEVGHDGSEKRREVGHDSN